MNHLKLNLVPCGYNPKDYKVVPNNIFKVTANSNKVVDLSQYCSPIKNQGKVGSCTAFSTIACMEYLQKKNNINLKMLSERFTYYATRVNILNQDASDSGASIRDALKSVVKYGSCLLSSFPYTGDYTTKPATSVYMEASKYIVLKYARFDDVNSVNKLLLPTCINNLKASLDAGIPIIGGFNCYNGIYNDIKGVIPLQSGDIIGGHAIFIVGYDDNKKLFKFKNSWGMYWGDKGYGYLPYDYYLKGDLYDLWSIYNQNIDISNIGLNIINPAIKNMIFKNEIQDIFNSITDILSTSMDKTQIDKLINPIINKYRSNQQIVKFINNTILQLKTLL
jgi:C1A family cysteine protease